MIPPLLEREAEIAALEAALGLAARGRGGVRLVTGPAGIGKTALIGHLRERAEDRDVRVLSSRCTPLTPTIGHAVVRDWFGLRAGRAAGAPPFDGPAAVLAGDGAPVGDLVYAARWVLEDDTRSGPVLLVVDDVHWADEVSLAFLAGLAESLDDLGCLLVVGLRTGEPVAAPADLERLLATAEHLRPAPLSPVAVRALAGDDPRADRVAEASGGVPFFVHAMLGEPGTGATPRPVVDQVSAHLARLGPETTRVAQAVAMLQGAEGEAAVAALAEVPASELSGHVARLVEAQVLAADCLVPAHPLVGEAVLTSMGTIARYDAHRRAAALLTALGADPDLVAGHLARTAPGDSMAVRQTLAAAGRRALASGAAGVAAQLLTRALDEAPGADDEPALLALAGRATAAGGHPDESVDLWRRAARLTEDPEAAALHLAGAGYALHVAGRHAEAHAVYASALAPLAPSSPARKRLTSRMATVGLITEGEATDLQRLVGEVVDQAAEDDLPEDRLLLGAAASTMTLAGGPLDRVRELALRSAGNGALLREETAQGVGVYVTSGALVWAELFDEAGTLLDAAVDEARARSWSDALGTASYSRGYLRMHQGRITEALADLGTAQSLRRLGWRAYVPVLLQAMVVCHLARGHVDVAGALEDDLVSSAESGPKSFKAFVELARGDLAQARTRHREAVEHFERAGALVQRVTDNPAVLAWRSRAAISLARLGDVGRAEALAGEELLLARAWGGPLTVAETLLRTATIRPSGGREPLLRQALALPGLPHGRTRHEIAVALGEVLLLHGRLAHQAEIREWAEAADSYAAEESLRPLGARAARLLDSLGLPARSRSTVEVAGLSPAERRVADLAASGLTNRQIAGHLFLTVKAVEWHLSACYRKLGIRTRQELPATLGRPPSARERDPA